jgi:hypothetical protein
MIDAAVAGWSHKRIADRHNCSVADVQRVLDAHARAVLRPDNRVSQLAIQLARMMELQVHFMRTAIETNDPTAGMLCVRLGQRIAALTGIDQPQRLSLEAQPPEHDGQSSTFKMIAIIRALKGEPPVELDAEAETPADQLN